MWDLSVVCNFCSWLVDVGCRVRLRLEDRILHYTATNFRPRDRTFQVIEAFLVSLDVHLHAKHRFSFDLCKSYKTWNITDLLL